MALEKYTKVNYSHYLTLPSDLSPKKKMKPSLIIINCVGTLTDAAGTREVAVKETVGRESDEYDFQMLQHEVFLMRYLFSSFFLSFVLCPLFLFFLLCFCSVVNYSLQRNQAPKLSVVLWYCTATNSANRHGVCPR